MSTERLQLVQQIVAQAMLAAPQSRDAVLDRLCSGDASLRSEVASAMFKINQATLAGNQTEPDAAEDDAVGHERSNVGTAVPNQPCQPRSANSAAGTADATDFHRGHANPAKRFGTYTLLEQLGEGGMGLVYLARQDRTERTVALKVIRPGLHSASMLRRFELEGRTLARLQHPGIAQIFDAGITRHLDGREQPYVALEHVRGVDIRTHAEANRLSVTDRVALLIQVCSAVAHAHTKGIIHRDLKPANILVDPTGQPKVLDFGVARLAERDSADALATLAGQIVGTIPYMSPEQIAGEPEAVDTRTDVYALGVMLYELLTGQLPHELTGKTIVEAARVIEREHATPIGKLDATLAGDLQTIVGKAIQKDRSQRYQSPSDLADDLTRFLNHEPIHARPANAIYIARKFVRRNRPLVALGIAATVLLLAGAAGTLWQAVRATRGWQSARIEASAAAAANDLLVRTIESADPEHNLGQSLSMRDVLDEMSAIASAELIDQPRVELSVRSTLARTYRSLDAHPQAERNARRSLDLSKQTFGERSLNAIRAERELGMILAQAGDFDEAEAIARRNIDTIITRFGLEHPEASLAKGELARVLQETGRWDEAEPLLREAVDLGVRNRGEADPEVLVAMHNLGTSLKDAGRLEEGEATLRRVVEIRRSVHGQNHPQTAYSINNLAAVLQKRGQSEEALSLFSEALATRVEMLGPDHQSTLTTRMNIAVCLITLGRPAEAEPHLRAGLEGYTRKLGERHAKTIIAMGNLAYLLEEQGHDEEAESLYRRVVELRRTTQGGKDPETWAAINNLAMLLQREARLEEAEPLLRELVETCQRSLPKGHYYTAIFANNLGDLLADLGRLDEAEPLLNESLAQLVAALGETHPRAEKARVRIARVQRLLSERQANRR